MVVGIAPLGPKATAPGPEPMMAGCAMSTMLISAAILLMDFSHGRRGEMIHCGKGLESLGGQKKIDLRASYEGVAITIVPAVAECAFGK